MEKICFEPIGFIKSKLRSRYEAPRQGVMSSDTSSYIELVRGRNFEQGLRGIEGFSRLWIVYTFHLNSHWKPMVNAPRRFGPKVGVFATRAPYRPNSIGLSCVKLEKVTGLKIYISQSDILDGSPVLDIKPYLPYSDSFPEATTGWVQTELDQIYTVEFSEEALTQAEELFNQRDINLFNYAQVQLSFNPHDEKRKRIKLISEGNKVFYTLAYQTWRMKFTIRPEERIVRVEEIFSVV